MSTHDSEAGPKPRSASMWGSATFTTVASRMSMSWATRTSAIPAAARAAFGGRSVGTPVGTVVEECAGGALDVDEVEVEDMGGGPVLA